MAKKQNTDQSSNAQMVIQELVKRPARIETTSIGAWREAVNSAKNGWRIKLYNLYENLLSDPILSDAIDKRINAITNAEIAFLKNGQSVPEIDDLIDTPAFEELIREMLLSKAWGKSVIEASFTPDFDVFSFPRKNIYIANMSKRLAERKRYIVEREGNLTGYDYSQDEFILECGKDDDLGFIFQAAPYVIYKRGGWGDWAEFAEVFGRHFIIGKYFGNDITTRDKLFAEIENIGSGLKAAIPKEADLEVIQNQTSGNNTLFNTFVKACDEQILIAVLGNLMTTLNGSSRSQAEVHQDTQQDINKSDRRFIQRNLNKWLVPLLIKRGYDAAGGFFVFPDQAESLTTTQRLDMAIKLKNDAKVPVSDDYFYEISGIPKPEGKQPKQEPPKIDPPVDNSKSKKKGLRGFFVSAPGSGAAKRPNLVRRLIDNTTGNINLSADYSINVASLVDEALREIYNNPDQGLFNPRLFEITNAALQQAITVEVNQESDDWGKTNKAFVNQFRENAAVFSAFKNHQQTNEIVGLLTDENGNTRSFSKFKKLALQVSKDYNVNWLQTEYNTATRSARAAINYRKFLETEHLYPNLEYMESTAEHKRIDHLLYVGTILPIRHVWWEKHLPPGEWNCQCWVRQSNKPATAVPGEDEPIDPVFANNPGQTAKMVNTEETPYYTETDTQLRAAIEDLARRAERIRQRLAEIEFERTNYNSGGHIDVPKTGQNKNEIAKNVEVYSKLGKTGGKYALLDVVNAEGKKNPDAVNLIDYTYSDAKTTTTLNVKSAVQNSIKAASMQKVDEVVIQLSTEANLHEIKRGLMAAFQNGRASTVKKVIIIDSLSEISIFNIDEFLAALL